MMILGKGVDSALRFSVFISRAGHGYAVGGVHTGWHVFRMA